MKTRTEICEGVRDTLWALEAAHDAQIQAARVYVAQLQAAKVALGLTGTMGDAAIARAQDHLATLELSREQLTESHEEAFIVLKATRVPNVAIGNKWTVPTGEAEVA
jgi:hypothetical protein